MKTEVGKYGNLELTVRTIPKVLIHMSESAWGNRETQFFYALTPEKVLDVVEQSLGVRCSGRTMAHASMENRVYEIELETDEGRPNPRDLNNYRIAKFYRPGRWSKEQILEEHAYLLKLKALEIPVVAPLTFVDGLTLHELENSGIYYTVFPKVAGRSPQEINHFDIQQIGRLLARMHNVGAEIQTKSRLELTPDIYLRKNFQYLLEAKKIPQHLEKEFQTLIERVLKAVEPRFQSVKTILLHGDCHLGNLLQFGESFSWVDFDDCIRGPSVQDLWLLLPGRDQFAQRLMDELIESYETMRPFPREELRLIEALRFFRMVHFAAWIGKRHSDPAFQRAFPQYGSEAYWRELLQDLTEQEGYVNTLNLWD